MSKENSIWGETRDLHHACETHAVGYSLSIGKPPVSWYASWLNVLLALHGVVDSTLPQSLGKVERLKVDIQSLNFKALPNAAAAKYAATLTTDESIAAVAYVLTGAHLMGGEIMRRRLEGFSTTHLEWDNRQEGLAWLKIARNRTDITKEVRDCFAALLSVMDEILLTYPQ